MNRMMRWLAGCSVAVALLLPGVVLAASAPTLFAVGSATPTVSPGGIERSWPIKVDEQAAMKAVFSGGLWLPNPVTGRSVFVRYKRHILHADGVWTWIGSVPTAHGEQSVVLTFGNGAVFGIIPQASGYPLQIVTRRGHVVLVHANRRALSEAPWVQRMRTHSDAVVPPRLPGHRISERGAPVRPAAVFSPATATNPVTITVMVLYTPDFVSEVGGQQKATTRIHNLVDVTNQAYVDSGVHQQIELVYSYEVNYPVSTTTDDNQVLDDLQAAGTASGSYPASLQGVAALRRRYAADLVTLIHSFMGQSDCGLGYENGQGQVPITPADAAYGFSVVDDGSYNSTYCMIGTFAHELGHNMGNDHDRATATSQGSPGGAYPYSYGYIGTGAGGAGTFATIMAYPGATDTPVLKFSNPNVATCENVPCGVSDSASNSADNAHSMNNTAAIVAAFEGPHARNDVNGDGKSDILFTNPTTGQLVYWLMSGNHYNGYAAFYAGPQYRIIGTGDFNGDHKADIVWTDGTNVWLWLSNGNGGYSGAEVGSAPSVYYAASDWKLMGTGDIFSGQPALFWYSASLHELQVTATNGSSAMSYYSMCQLPAGMTAVGVGDLTGNGMADAVFEDASYHAYVLMGGDYSACYNGGSDTIAASNGVAGPGYVPAGISDVNGDGYDDVVWVNPATGTIVYWLMNGANYTGYGILSAGPGYSVASVADFDGDGMADILWSKGNNLYMWLHNSAGKFYGTTVGPYAAGWNIVP